VQTKAIHPFVVSLRSKMGHSCPAGVLYDTRPLMIVQVGDEVITTGGCGCFILDTRVEL
jgi:hypothetical protein